jgi:hypothetical protein
MRTFTAVCLAAALFGCGRPEIPGPITQPMPQTQPLTGCAGRSVIAMDGATLKRLAADGTTTTLFHFGDGLPDSSVLINGWQQAGGFIAAYAFLEDDQTGSAIRYEYLVLDAQGNAVFHQIQTEPYNPNIYLSSDGTLSVAGGEGFIVRNGTVTHLGSFMPLEAMLPNGQQPVAQGMPWDAATVKGVLDVGNMQFTPLSPAPDSSTLFFEANGELAYVTGNSLVIGGNTLALPATDTSWYYGLTAADRYVELYGNGRFVVADASTQQLFEVENLPTPGEGRPTTVTVAADGTVYAGFFENSLLQLRHSADHGTSWDAVGDPMTPGQNLGAGQWLTPIIRGGSVLIENLTAGYGDFLASVQLVGDGAKTSVATSGLYINAHLSPSAADLSSDGQCAAVWVPDDPQMNTSAFTLHFVDAAHGATTAQTSDHVQWLRFQETSP